MRDLLVVLWMLSGAAALAQTEDEGAPTAAAPEAAAPEEEAEDVTAVTTADGLLVYNFAPHPAVPIGEGPVRITAETSTLANTWGYSTIRVAVENTAPTPHEVTLEFAPSVSGASVRKRVELPAGGRTNVVLLAPAGANYGPLVAHSAGLKGGAARSSIYMQNPTAAGRTLLALGTDLQFQDAAKVAPNTGAYTTLVRTLDAADAPAELAAYVGFNQVVVLVPFEQLSEAARRALEGYAATGGTLTLVNPPRHAGTYLPLLGAHSAQVHEYGFGHLRLCAGATQDCAEGIAQDLELAPQAISPLAPSTPLARASLHTQNGRDIPEAERYLLPQAAAPVGRFLLIILAFTLAIGPGSVWVARKRGPPMLLITIPLTAAITCLLIVGYSVLVDGFAVHASTRGYTLLDSKNKRAITVGVAAFYANLAPGSAEFDTASAVVSPTFQGRSPQVVSVDWTNGAAFGGDFIPSRTYREWGVLAVHPTRARLLLRRSEDGRGVTVQNALGADIRIARLAVDGKEWVVRNVRDGGSAAAEQAAVTPALPDGVLEFSSRFDPRIAERSKRALREGQFLAQVEGPAFLPTGGLRLAQHSSEQLVRGEVER